MSSWLPIFFGVGLVALVIAVCFTLADWKTRGPRYLVSVALALTAVIFSGWLKWCYKPPRKPKDYELVKNRVVRDFKQKKATRLTITRSGKSVTLEKQQGKWQCAEVAARTRDHKYIVRGDPIAEVGHGHLDVTVLSAPPFRGDRSRPPADWIHYFNRLPKRELYHLPSDPHELDNLVEKEAATAEAIRD